MTMCKAENRSLARCVDVQKKFLKALGYVSMNARPEEESEQIQMHADRLYHRMLDHEKVVEQAKEMGKTPPPLPPLLDSAQEAVGASREHEQQRASAAAMFKRGLTLDELPPHLQQRLTKRYLDGLEGQEREIAKRGLDHDIEAHAALVEGVHERWIEDHRARLKRRAEGREQLDDKIFKYFDFRQYPEELAPEHGQNRGSP